jgi:hypothetical protein
MQYLVIFPNIPTLF